MNQLKRVRVGSPHYPPPPHNPPNQITIRLRHRINTMTNNRPRGTPTLNHLEAETIACLGHYLGGADMQSLRLTCTNLWRKIPRIKVLKRQAGDDIVSKVPQPFTKEQYFDILGYRLRLLNGGNLYHTDVHGEYDVCGKCLLIKRHVHKVTFLRPFAANGNTVVSEVECRVDESEFFTPSIYINDQEVCKDCAVDAMVTLLPKFGNKLYISGSGRSWCTCSDYNCGELIAGHEVHRHFGFDTRPLCRNCHRDICNDINCLGWPVGYIDDHLSDFPSDWEDGVVGGNVASDSSEENSEESTGSDPDNESGNSQDSEETNEDGGGDEDDDEDQGPPAAQLPSAVGPARKKVAR